MKMKVINHPVRADVVDKQKRLVRSILRGDFEDFVFAGRRSKSSVWSTAASCDAMQALWAARLIEQSYGQGEEKEVPK